jgi:hypothetical protein
VHPIWSSFRYFRVPLRGDSTTCRPAVVAANSAGEVTVDSPSPCRGGTPSAIACATAVTSARSQPSNTMTATDVRMKTEWLRTIG